MTRPVRVRGDGHHALVVRADNNGDVLLTGPAIRAVADRADRVTLLCGPRGQAAAELLPGVDAVVCRPLPWIDAEPAPVTAATAHDLVTCLGGLRADTAVVFTSFHQSALPTALLARMAGIPFVGAISGDYPGSLLDVRHHVPDDRHEVQRALSLAAACGYPSPAGDDVRLRVRVPLSRRPRTWGAPYVVVHPGASVPARAWSPDRHRALVDTLAVAGWHVVVTGSAAEVDLTRHVCGHRDGPRRAAVTDLGGRTALADLAAVLTSAQAVVAGNTGPAHLAAAVGTPVVSLFAPTVPAVSWRPWGVPHVVLGNQAIACAGCRATDCPVAGHPCLAAVGVDEVVAALERLTSAPRPHRAWVAPLTGTPA